MIGGCDGTSNVLAGKMFDLPVLGTHAHSWIMSFADQYTAFKTYASLYPDACMLLVDTCGTLKSGVPNAIRVFKELRDEGLHPRKIGIRLDSGDLAYLSKKARAMLDDAGFPEAIISASSDLDENLIQSLKLQGAPITSWGVGTSLLPPQTALPSVVYISLQLQSIRVKKTLRQRSRSQKIPPKLQIREIKLFIGFMTRLQARSVRI